MSKLFAGPELPPHLRANVDEDQECSNVIGPVLSNTDTPSTSIAHQVNSRAQRMKHKLTNETTEKVVRDSWMTEIPDHIPLGLPVAKTRFGDGRNKIDRKGWESTPKDKLTEDTSEEGPSLKRNFKEERDSNTASSVDTYNEKMRSESLLEIHQKKLKKEKKKDKKAKKDSKKKKKHKDKTKEKSDRLEERKPFDRERDLQVNVFDDAKKKALIKHSQQLSSRFSSSTVQGQFL